ncbi:MAG: hypothetical protein ACP5T3_03765, partial [Candidatus Micrarchaeia archaeon]
PNGATISFGSPINLNTLYDNAGLSGTATSMNVALIELYGYNGSEYIEPIYETTNAGASWTHIETLVSSADTGYSPYGVYITPIQYTYNSIVQLIQFYQNAARNYAVYNGIGWTSGTFGSKTADNDDNGYGAYTNGNYIYFVGMQPEFNDQPYFYTYNTLSNTWSSGTEISSANVSWVNLGAIDNKVLAMLYTNSTGNLYYRLMPFATQKWSQPFFLASGVSQASLQYGNGEGKIGVAIQTTNNALYFDTIPLIGPIPVTFDDNPNTASVSVNGTVQVNGNVVSACEGGQVFTINAIAPSTGNWVFSSWGVNTATNLSVSNIISANALLTVNGTGTVTATWNGITKFFETGLPSGSTWNVT